MSKARMQAPKLSVAAKNALDISRFCGESFAGLENGMLFDSDNACVLSGGAVSSMLAERKIDIGSMQNIEGVYTFCGDCDSSYETKVTPEWVYKNVCPKDIIEYSDWQLISSRLLIKDVGMPAKNENGYRKILGAFADDGKTYVFYEGYYNVIDERRSEEFKAVGSALAYVFTSGKDGDYTGSLNVYTLVQTYLDVIDSYGNVTTSLVSAKMIANKKISDSRYSRSMMISTDKENYRYVTPDYIPIVGENYTAYFDRVYTEIYSDLNSEYPPALYNVGEPIRAVRYCNAENGASPFGSSGEKLLVMPEMRLLEQSDGEWKLSGKSEDMPTLCCAVQYFDRLFGIYGDTVYSSVSGDCSNFSEDAWQMVTGDSGGFSAITSYDGKVVVFTKESMMTVYNVEKPFSLSHVGNIGCVSQEALATVSGYLYFVSKGGVMRYNGSSVKCISDTLPRKTDYSAARLTSACNTLVLSLGDLDDLWFYDAASEEWSKRKLEYTEACFAGETMFVKQNGGFYACRIFDEFGDFSFKIAVKNGGRRRVKSISVTAAVGYDSELVLTDKNGETLLEISYPEERVQTRTVFPRMMYIDNGELSFVGHGECTLYGIRIEYAPLFNAARRL